MTAESARAVLAIPIAVAVLCLGAHTVAFAASGSVPPAYRSAARRAGVPATVLYAVALQESGTRLRDRVVPWPWTLNVAGRAERFRSRVEACSGLRQAVASTALRDIDVGLGQINLGYQSHRYVSACELLDPYRNLAIAAQILQEQHLPEEDWLAAVGRYHRPAGGDAAASYRLSVRRHLVRLLAPPTSSSRSPIGTP
jgi:soluble lytic murein transglycosylase-like protein